ncbi:MAG: YaiI/YqxD family protein [Pseudomonadales bacterium]
MKVWIDGDACPVVIKEILFRAADKREVETVIVANHHVRTPASKFIRSMQVASGFDAADNEIVRLLEAGDLVITSDIPLAAEVMEKGGLALSPRGSLHTEENIRQRLNMRDFNETLRASGINSGGPPPINQTNKQDFANHLDRIITRAQRLVR